MNADNFEPKQATSTPMSYSLSEPNVHSDLGSQLLIVTEDRIIDFFRRIFVDLLAFVVVDDNLNSKRSARSASKEKSRDRTKRNLEIMQGM